MGNYFPDDRTRIRDRFRKLIEGAKDEKGQSLFPLQDRPGSPGYTIREMFVRLFQQHYQQLNAVLDGNSPLTARGQALDDWAEFFGMQREGARRPEGEVEFVAEVDGETLERLTGTRVIEAGAPVTYGSTTLETTTRAEIPKGGNSVTVGVRGRRVRSGVVVEAGANLRWPSNEMINARAITDVRGGRSTEDDEQLRFRLSRALRAPSTLEGLEVRMLAHPDVDRVDIAQGAYGPGTAEVFVHPAVAFPDEQLRQELEAISTEGVGQAFVTFPAYEGIAMRIKIDGETGGIRRAISDYVANLESGQELIINQIEQIAREQGARDAQVIALRRGVLGDDTTMLNPRTTDQVTNTRPSTDRHRWYTKPAWITLC